MEINYFNGDELAQQVWEKKYQYKNETLDEMFDRIYERFNHTFAPALVKGSIRHWLKDFKYIVPQGSVLAILGTDIIGSLSNCFVIGQPEDSYGGIFEKDQQTAQLMKRRGGVGLDLSSLRPKGTNVNNSAKTSTGAVSFMERFSNTTREVAQGGRRGALMLTIKDDHPDIMEFITIKRDLTKVTGANISVKISDEFMRKLHNKDPEKEKIWKELIKSARDYAEPGIMFEDNHHNFSPDSVYSQYKGITTNPCGEIFMQEYDACRLILLNLFSFVEKPFTKDAFFNYDLFYSAAHDQQIMADALVDLEIEQITKIIQKIESDPESEHVKQPELDLWQNILKVASEGRRTGSGITALGDMLAALGVKYDSDEAKEITEKVMKTKMKGELDAMHTLVRNLGPFVGWNRHKEFTTENGKLEGRNGFYQRLIDLGFKEEMERMYKYGRRNVSWSTVAPAGSVSILTQTTSGIEPLFMPYYTRRRKINPDDEGAQIDFVDQNGDSWQEYFVLHHNFKRWAQINYPEESLDNQDSLQALFEKSPWFGCTANDVDWLKRVELQAVVQNYTTHSISSTLNLPEDVSYEECDKIYSHGWNLGLKGLTIYRDGSRSGVLVSNKFRTNDAPKRPESLEAELFCPSVKGTRYDVVVGLMEGKPYEVFARESARDQWYTDKGAVKKIRRGEYEYIHSNGDIDHLDFDLTGEQEAITRLASGMLRHGAPIKFVVEQLNKCPGDLTEFYKAIARTLKKYIADGEKAHVICNECGSQNVIYEEGCAKCLNCGSSKCG